ncbi:MAG: FAD-dependent oxidoreductase [Rhodoferax sp.]
MKRRHFIAGSALPLLGCTNTEDIAGGFTGVNHQRGHMLRDSISGSTPLPLRKTSVLILGGGIAGLAAARALHRKRIDDFALLELEDTVGGNSRGGVLNGIDCPLGAHYLPLPGNDAPAVQDLLEELGLRRRVAGRWQYDERHLCHSPQERLFFNGAWQDGLLPLQDVGDTTLSQYRKMAELVGQLRKRSRWTIPALGRPLDAVQLELATLTFAAFLDQQGLHDRHLRWYLDYCCRDDYGAGLASVSAWAGIHYFASRHGFSAPGHETQEREALLTWPEGNAWLVQRFAAPFKERLHSARVVLRIANAKHGVEVDAFNATTQTLERWQAQRAIVALPLLVAARVTQNAPDFLRQAAGQIRYAPWLVANIHLSSALIDRPGAAPSWDNVLYGTPGLGYVDAMHQSLQSASGATVLTYYRALGDWPDGRRLLLNRSWEAWRDEILAELSLAHPDLAHKTSRIDITRYGHAMAIPAPRRANLHSVPARSDGRLSFAHGDWSGYSIFEETFTLGHRAASQGWA